LPAVDRGPGGSSVGWNAALAGGLAVLATVALLRAINKPLWFDEIFTLILARMESPAEIIEALRVPIDALPPPYYMICRATLLLAPDEHVGIRLPSVCGFLVAIACTYAFLAVRVDRISALTAAAFVACTALADYAFEARPYALMTGSLCAAACCWQRVDRSWVWAVALACGLALAVSCHPYAIFAWPAFALAEVIVLASEHRVRPRVWLALAIGIVPFIACWPLLANFRAAFGQHWWSAPGLAMVLLAPQVLFKWSGGMWGPAVTAALVAVCIAWIVRATWPSRRPASVWFPASPLTPAECGLVVGLLAIPVVAVVAVRLAHGGLTDRYMMPSIIGAALAIGALTSTAPPAFRALALAIMLVDYGITARPAFAAWAKGELLESRSTIRESLQDRAAGLGDATSPIVMANGFQYMQAIHYCDRDAMTRTWAIADPAAAIDLSPGRSDVIDRSLRRLSRPPRIVSALRGGRHHGVAAPEAPARWPCGRARFPVSQWLALPRHREAAVIAMTASRHPPATG
jgi:hypothetical protein